MQWQTVSVSRPGPGLPSRCVPSCVLHLSECGCYHNKTRMFSCMKWPPGMGLLACLQKMLSVTGAECTCSCSVERQVGFYHKPAPYWCRKQKSVL